MDKTLTPIEAARRIFDSAKPSDQQVGLVIQMLKSGELKRASPDAWTTTVDAIADYLARVEKSSIATKGRGKLIHGTTPIGPKGESVSSFYSAMIKDYFLAVVLKRGMKSHSTAFQRVVIGSQAVLLGLGLAVIIYAGAMIVRNPFVPPEHRIVESWLQSKYKNLKIKTITPAANTPSAYVAHFRYQESGRVIDSKLVLTLQGTQVTNVNSGE